MHIAMRRLSLGAGALLLASSAALSAQNSEQVVFSTPGFDMTLSHNSKGTSTPFGFWIWCAAEAAAHSKGGYQAENICQGSMYFYALDKHATHVIGFVTEDEEHAGVYTMNVIQGTPAELFAGTLNPDYMCQLTNKDPDTKGPGHSVDVHCQFLNPALGGGTGSAVVTNAVVDVTGRP